MKIRFLSIVLMLAVALGCLSGCSLPGGGTAPLPEADTVIRFSGDQVAITGAGASLDGGDVVIAEGGVYEVSGVCGRSRVIVKAPEDADVTILLAGLRLTNPEDEAIYFKTCGSAAVILKAGTENVLISGEEPLPEEEQELLITDEGEDPSGAALRARCAMTVSGEGSLTVCGYINNGIAADGGLTIESGEFDVTAVNDAVKSDGNITVTGGTFTVNADHDGFTAGLALTIGGGVFDVTTGAASGGADMKVSDSSMMGQGGMGGPGGGRGNRRSSDEASAEAEAAEAEETTESTTEAASDEAAAETETTDSTSGETSGEMPRSGGMGGMPMPGFDDMMDAYDADALGSDSYKGLKAGESITVTGGVFRLDCEDDAVHSDGTVTVTGGALLLLSGDDGIRAGTELLIAGGEVDVQYCYEGLEATSILITGGSTNIVATDDGMNAGGGMMGMMGGPSREASTEAETDGTTTEEATEFTNPIVRITGGTVIVDSGGDGLDSNGSMYIEGGTVFVSGPSTNWDSPIDCGEGSNEFVVTGGHFMAAGYAAMVETPEAAENAQSSIFYAQSGYAPDGALVTLTDDSGRILAEYSFAHSFNCVMVSTPEMAQGETYTLTIDGVDTPIEMTTAVWSNRGGSGEMGRGGRP